MYMNPRPAHARRLFLAAGLFVCALSPVLPQAGTAAAIDAYRRWALALPGIVFELNGQRNDILGPYEPGKGDIEEQKRSLEQWWGVSNRGDLLTEISDLEYDGHSPLFRTLIELAGTELRKGRTPEQIVADKKLGMKGRDLAYLQFIALNYDRFEGRNVFLWDWGRIISLARWGFYCDYLDEDEAWKITLDAADKIFANYHSWEEYGELYCLTRAAWAAGFGEELIYYTRAKQSMRRLMGKGGAWDSAAWPAEAPGEEER